MKQALFINSLDGGGAERVVISLLNGMMKRGVQIELICMKNMRLKLCRSPIRSGQTRLRYSEIVQYRADNRDCAL